MSTVVVSPSNVANFPEGGGHFWVYMQYAEALRRLGCDVHLLDSLAWSTQAPDDQQISAFFDRLARHGFEDGAIVAAASAAASSISHGRTNVCGVVVPGRSGAANGWPSGPNGLKRQGRSALASSR